MGKTIGVASVIKSIVSVVKLVIIFLLNSKVCVLARDFSIATDIDIVIYKYSKRNYYLYIPLFRNFDMLFKKKDPNSLAVEFDIEGTMQLQKESLCTNPDRMYGYMWYLIRNYLGINQQEMGASFFSGYKEKYRVNHGLSKSAYSKVENGHTSINFDLILIYSERFGFSFDILYNLYSYLLKLAYDNNCIYIERCGYLGLGKMNSVLRANNVSKEYLYTDLKNYYKFFQQSDLDSINQYLDQYLNNVKNVLIFEKQFKEENKGKTDLEILDNFYVEMKP